MYLLCIKGDGLLGQNVNQVHDYSAGKSQNANIIKVRSSKSYQLTLIVQYYHSSAFLRCSSMYCIIYIQYTTSEDAATIRKSTIPWYRTLLGGLHLTE